VDRPPVSNAGQSRQVTKDWCHESAEWHDPYIHAREILDLRVHHGWDVESDRHSREVAATEAAVVTVGVLQAGTKENVSPDEAVIKLNVRTFDAGVRRRVLDAIARIVHAEAEASGAPRPPEITPLDSYPLNVNDKAASDLVAAALRAHFPADRVRHTGAAPASEDFGCFGTEWHAPSVFWFVGGTDPSLYAKAKEEGRINELPVNHSPHFAPVLHPTLETGAEAMVTAALAWNAAR